MTEEDFQTIRSDFKTWYLRARWASHGTLANYLQDFKRLADKVAEGKEYQLNHVVNLDINPEKDGHVEEDQEVIQMLQTSINRITEKFAEKATDKQLNESLLKAHLKRIHEVIKDEAKAVLSKERASSFDIPRLKEKYVVQLRQELRANHKRSMARFFRQQGEHVVRVQRRKGFEDTVELIDAVTAETYVVLNNLVFPESLPMRDETKRTRYLTNFITPKTKRKGLSDEAVTMSQEQLEKLVSLDVEDFASKIKDYEPAKMNKPGHKTSLHQAKIQEPGSMLFERVD
jgi:hypothetical protein